MIHLAATAALHAKVAHAVEPAVLSVLRGGHYIGGPVVAAAEAALAHAFGQAGAVGVGSGTDALTLTLQALGVGAGEEVIVPALSFFATAEAVSRCGATPVAADVLPDSPVLDPSSLPLTSRTRAVVAVHLFGEVAPLPPLGLPILADASQAIGAALPPATAVAASLYPTKTVGAAGDGGVVASDDPALLAAVRRLANHGMAAPHQHGLVAGHVGTNSRLDAMQAAVVCGHLPDLPRRLAARRANAARYDDALPAWVRRVPRSAAHVVHQYVVRVPQRAAVMAALREAGIESAVYYPRPMPDQPAWRGPAADVPNARAFCAEALALPVHSELSPRDLDRVIDTLGSLSLEAG